MTDPHQAKWRLHRFITRSLPHHSPEVIMAALDDLNSIATALEAVPEQIAAAEANAVAGAEADLEPVVAKLQAAVAAIQAALPAAAPAGAAGFAAPR